MQNTVFNGLELFRSKRFEGLTDENLLSQALLTQPHQASTVLSYVFGAMDKQSPLALITGGIGRTMVIESNSYQWDLMIDSDKPVTIKNSTWQGNSIASTDTPGINGTPIQIWCSEKFFGPGAIIEFDDKEFQARVVSEPYQDGHDWVYTVVVADGQANSYIDPSLLEAGAQLSRVGSAYEEGSEEADKIDYQTPVKLKNYLTTMRLEYSITGSAYSSVMVIKMKEPKSGKTTTMWADYQEWIAMREWYKRTEYQLMYDKSTVNPDGTSTLKGTNGRPIYRGAGLLQQISPSNKRYYTTLTIDLLEEFLYDLSYNIRGFGERKFVLFTGEMGMKELDRVLREKASTYTLVDSVFVTGSGQNLTLGGQFTTYKMLNGVELSLVHFPLYDDTYHNRKLHPVTGKPIESYRMTLLDAGMFDGEPNIQKVVRKDREMVMWHVGGSVAPSSGHAKSITTVRSSSKDGYVVNFLGELGIMMKNPTTSGELVMETE